MKKLRIKDVVKFRRKAEGPRKTFIHNIIATSERQTDGDARNYWVRSESAIKSAFRYDDTQLISDKIEEVKELLVDTSLHSNTVKQYNHNITILRNMESEKYRQRLLN